MFIKKLFLKSEFTRNVLTLMSGATVAQAIPFLLSPVISRLFTPQDYSILALYLSILNPIVTIVTASYEQAIVLPEKDDEAARLFVLILVFTITASLISLPVFFLLNDQISLWLKNPAISEWLYYLPLSIFAFCMFQAGNYWSIRRRKFKLLSGSQVTQSLTNSAIMVGGGYLQEGPSGLVVGNIASQCVVAGLLSVPAWKDVRKYSDLFSQNELRDVAGKYSDFPKYNMPQAFLDKLRDSGINFMLSYFFLSGVLGAFAFILKVLKVPLSLLGLSFAQVFYQKASETFNAGKSMWWLYKETVLRLVIIAIPALIVLVATGPHLFAFVFGEEWRAAGEYARILAPWLLVSFISSPLSQVPLIVKKQKEFLIRATGYNLLAPLSLGVTALITKDAKLSLLVFSLFGSGYLISIMIWIASLTKIKKEA